MLTFAGAIVAFAQTAVVDSFDPNVTSSGVARVFAIALQSDGKILVGGSFTATAKRRELHRTRPGRE